MSKKYDAFIELTPGYESVIDISYDTQSNDFWSRYIVNEDMVAAVKLLSKSLRPDDPNEDVWHFWIKGSYGTGKTYSAIVIKHLLQDDYKDVEHFLNKNPLFCDVKDKFLSARKKGSYYVKFRSGECKQLDTSNKFLFQIEQSVREILQENNMKYTGRNSLIDSVKKTVCDFRPKLEQDFDNGEFPEYWGSYDNFADFLDEVNAGNVTACSYAQEILQSMNIGLATDLKTFKDWIKDIYDGNAELKKTGIFIIWDEFTEYIRKNDLDIIQQLSLFSKEIPFFIIYVMHEYPGVFSENVTAGLGKADARFHKIDISLSEKTTFKLIGESIITRDGMKENWADTCDELYNSISSCAHSFMGEPGDDLDVAALKKIFPIHPMTVGLVSKVAGLAASNRSIFEFLKSSGDDGFRAYIRNNGIDDWRWVTLDYLWDYFFVNNQGGKKDLTKTAEDALKHYNKVKDQINDDKVLRVFKGAMLLLATIGSGHSLKKSKSSRGVLSTEKTLADCFVGVLSKEDVSKYLHCLSDDLNLLVLAPDIHEGSRIELPYSGTVGELDAEIEKIRKEYTPGKLFSSDGDFGNKLRERFVSDDKAVIKRLMVDTCYGTKQLNAKFAELKKSIEKYYHRFGLLLVCINDSDELERTKGAVSLLLNGENTNKMIVCILEYPADEDLLKRWYELAANMNLAQKTGNNVNANSYKSQSFDLVDNWVSTAIGKYVTLMYEKTSDHLYTNKAVLKQYEKIVFKLFPSAPENIIKKTTLYKTPALAPAYYGVTKTTLQNKNAADDGLKGFNQQWQDCVDILSDGEENVWDCTSIEEVMAMNSTKVGRSMASLCSYLNRNLTSGTVILTELWDGLQQELGYYDTSVCCYLLGFAFHFYIGKYTWFDGNNSHKLDVFTIRSLIVDMLTGKAAGMKISSESDIEKRFKDVTRRLFGLSAEETGDVYDCRKNLKIHVTRKGFPVWTLKYLNADEYSGIQDEVSDIVDKYVEYILEIGNQNAVMEDIVELVKKNARVYVDLISSLFADKNKLVVGMKNYIFLQAPEAKAISEEYGFSDNVIFSMLARTLEEEKWQWREDEVSETSKKLTLDLLLVGIINRSIEGKAESVEKIRETLANYLDYICIPGCVYADTTYEWAHSVSLLHDIATNKWFSFSNQEKESVLQELKSHVVDAIENIAHPINVLKHYIDKNNMGSFSDDEYVEILNSLPKEPYSQTEHSFKTNITNKIKDLAYTKKTTELLKKWKEKTGVDNVFAWTSKHIMPIEWMMPECNELFSVISGLSKHERVDEIRLDNACTSIDDIDFSILKNGTEADKTFIIYVSSKRYIDILLPHIKEIKTKIQDNGCRNYENWNNEIVKIRAIVENYISNDLRSEVSDKAKKRIKQIKNIDQLRAELEKVIDNSSEACLLLLEEE